MTEGYTHIEFILPEPRTPSMLLDRASRALAQAGIPSSRREITWLLEEATDMDRTALLVRADDPVSSERANRFASFMQRRLQREPVQYIVGYTEFFGLRINVTPDVLIPRPETEGLVELCLDRLGTDSEPEVVDLGTGSGCIALAVKSRCPAARVTAVDRSPAALEIARQNGKRTELSVRWIEGDFYSAVLAESLGCTMDLLVSNPPYVPAGELELLEPEVAHYEPGEALFPRGDPMDTYRALGERGLELLREGGWVLTEIHAPDSRDVAAVFTDLDYQDVSTELDLAGRERFVSARRPKK